MAGMTWLKQNWQPLVLALFAALFAAIILPAFQTAREGGCRIELPPEHPRPPTVVDPND